MPSQDTVQPAPTQAVRLIFEYEGDQVRLVSQQAVDMVVTGFDLMQAAEAGVFVDARDAADTVLARVPAHSAFAASTEVFPENPKEPIVRLDVPAPSGAFSVVVPAPAAASKVVVVRVAPVPATAELPPGRASAPLRGVPEVTEIASFPLEPVR